MDSYGSIVDRLCASANRLHAWSMNADMQLKL